MAEPYAVAMLRDADLRTRVLPGSTVALGSEAGVVENQRPAAGTARAPGSIVTLVVTVTADEEPAATTPPAEGG